MLHHTRRMALGTLALAALTSGGIAASSQATASPAHCTATIADNGNGTFTGTLSGCEKPGEWYLNVTNVDDNPQHGIVQPVIGHYPADTTITTLPIPDSAFGSGCTIPVQVDLRVAKHGVISRRHPHETSKFVKAYKTDVNKTTGTCAPSPSSSTTSSPSSPASSSTSPTSSPTTATQSPSSPAAPPSSTAAGVPSPNRTTPAPKPAMPKPTATAQATRPNKAPADMAVSNKPSNGGEYAALAIFGCGVLGLGGYGLMRRRGSSN